MTSREMSFVVMLPMLAGGLAGYASKKSGEDYFYEQGAVGAFAYTVGTLKTLANAASLPYTKGAIPALFLVPAAVVGGSLYVGNLIGRVANDARR